MQLYNVVTIIDRAREKFLRTICKELEIPMTLTVMGRGTATRRQLDFYGLEPTEKALVFILSDAEKKDALLQAAKERMFIDVPGNGVMMAIPLKSVGGGRTLAFLTRGETSDNGTPDLNASHELIMIVLNRGYTDDVMDAAREAGAGGGTVLHAKGTGAKLAQKFLGVTLAEEKEIILIAAAAQGRNAIMSAVAEHCGIESKAGAIAFSLPITEITGLRRLS
ncbi:MAG: P-II family nitrogen regulator [Lachnospiraceae bacterium]|nr:P-II family nitrogen regulator [Lachnospiraceae bacterium]MBR0092248.1 P-II family nitrogen regulator [Lachnospiraceae bacterium]